MKIQPIPSQPARKRTGQSGAEQRLLAKWRALAPSAGDRVVVGFSGGTDSLALAMLLARIVPVAGIRVTLVHIDHGARPESAQEAAHAAQLARAIGLPMDLLRLPSSSSSLTNSNEEDLRERRYRALSDAAVRHGARVIATAHQRDDQAETVLLHLLRGGGLAGAAGMAELAPLPLDDDRGLRLWRPLLEMSRRDLEGVVATSGLAPNQDTSNADPAFRRNWIRHEVMPVIERRVPSASEALARFAAISAEEDALLHAVAEAAYATASAEQAIVVVAMNGLPTPIARRVIRMWLGERAPGVEVSFDRIEAIRASLSAPSSLRRVEVGGGYAVLQRKRGGTWMLIVVNDGE